VNHRQLGDGELRVSELDERTVQAIGDVFA
jgi:hypothetical protein